MRVDKKVITLYNSDMGISLVELSGKIGLSTATITRALNGEGNVTEKTRREVLDAVQKYGYVPKTKRTTTRKRNSGMVMVITGSLENPVHHHLVVGIETELSKHGKHSVVVQTDYSEKLQEEYLQYARDEGFSCIMILNAIENSNLIRFLKSPSGPPVLFINREPESIEANSVTMDNFRSGYIAAKKLLENGHTRIMLISGPEDSTVCRARINGFCKGMEDHGLDFDAQAVFYGDRTYASGFSIGKKTAEMSGSERPTAVYALSGTMAGGFIDALNSNGLSIPDDLSIICNDSPSNFFAEKMSISSIEVDFRSMGEVAAKRYLEIMASGDGISKQILFMPTIYERTSIKNLGT